MSTSKLYRKIGIFSLVAFFALAAIAMAGYAWWSYQGEPTYEGSISLNNLNSEVSVDFDQSGIPHIKATNESDLYRTLGHVMAQDRLFQMDLLRRVVHGEVAEVFGEKALPVDILFRSLGLIYGMQERVKEGQVDPHLLSLMKSFYDGVNQYIDEGNWSYEYKLLGLTPKKFSVIDGYGILGYMSYSFAQSFKVDLLLDKIKKEKGEDFANSLRSYPHKKNSKKVGASSFHSRPSVDPQIWQEAHSWLEDHLGMFTGSNAWAVGPQKSESGAPLLASDPHVQFSLPGIWYEAVVDWGEGPFSGLFIPGVPFAAMGHRKELGWGVTISYIDDMDFYRETMSEDGEKILYKGQWLPMEKRHEVIKVKGEDDHELDLYWGVHGPILDKVHPLMEGKLAMKWGHFHEANQAPLAFYQMMKAKNRDEFTYALELAKSPGLNIIYADSVGNIGRYLVGSVPIRPDHMTGDLVYEGDSGIYDWQGDLEFDKRAHIINPPNQIIASANQKPEEGDYPGYYQPSDRYETIKSLLLAKKKWNIKELQYLQTSASSVMTFPLRDQMIKAIELDAFSREEEAKEAIEVLKNWDGIFDEDSVAASLFQQTLVNTSVELLAPIKDYYQEYCDTNFFSQHVKKRILRDNPFREIAKAFKDALKDLNAEHGSWQKASWGKLHTLTISHPLSKGGKLLASIFNLGPYPVSGAMDTINNLRRVGCRNGFKVLAGPSSRRLIDFSDAENSLAILPVGNSGHWKSPFFDNQWPVFKSGEYRKATLESEIPKEKRFGRLKFSPKK